VAREARKSGATEIFLQFAGAAGGTLLVLYLFGGLVLWVRFHAAGIPADQSLAPLPRELLVVVGLRTLVVEIVVFGVIASAATALAWSRNTRVGNARLPPATGVAVAATFVGALGLAAVLAVEFGYSRFRPGTGGIAQVAGAAVAAVVVASALYARWLNQRLEWSREARSPWPLRRAVVLSMPMVAVTAATIGLAFEAAKAPIFPAVKIIETGKAGRLEGFFVGETSSEILVGTGLCDSNAHRLQRLLVVPRSEIAAVVMTRSVRLTDEKRRHDAWKSLHVCEPSKS
jgi:hypothetical protein